jgi:hypothetical protein
MVLTTDLGDVVTGADRDWAITSLVAAAGTLQPFEYSETTDDQAASRAAARALPAAYASGQDRRDRDILPALHALATHPVLEVRRILAVNLRTTWAAPCRTTTTGHCLHQDVVEVLTSLVRDAVIPISPDGPQLTIDTIEALAMHPGAVLDSGVLGPALATAIDALTYCQCAALTAGVVATAQVLTDAFLNSLSRRLDPQSMEMTAAATARCDAHAGSINLIRTISARLIGTGALPAWHSGIRDAVASDPSLGPVIGGGWHRLAADLLSDIVKPTDLAALLPPAGDSWPTPADLADVLPTWLIGAIGSPDAVDTYCAWAIMHAVAGTEILDAIDRLIPDPKMAPKLWRIADLFKHLLSQPMTSVDESRTYRWIDAFAADGDTRFLQMQRDPT